MTPTDQARIAAAVAAAEAGTSAELVCVLVRASSGYEHVPLMWSAVVALAVPWVLIEATLWSAEAIFLSQLGVFALCLLVLSWPGLRMRLVPHTEKRRRAHRAAAEQFLLRRVGAKPGRTGVLIFVSVAERYARIIADEGVTGRIPDIAWAEAIAVLVAHAGRDRVADGFIEAVGQCGRLLAEHFPHRPGDHNELSDRVTVI